MASELKNRRIVITRDPSQAGYLTRRIEELGGTAIVFPTIQIGEPGDWKDCDGLLSQLHTYDWIVFSSLNGVNFFFRRLKELQGEREFPRIAAVGSRTAAAIEEWGQEPDVVPSEHSARGLLNSLSKLEMKGKRVLLPTSNIGHVELPKGLEELGAQVDRVEVYRTVVNRSVDAEEMRRQIRDNQIDCLTFFSPSAFTCLIEIIGDSMIEDIKRSDIAIAAIGPITTKAIMKQDLKVDIVPERSLEEDFVEALVEFYSSQSS